eukprot:6446611-Alexandrium_andersonii.AAC.1
MLHMDRAAPEGLRRRICYASRKFQQVPTASSCFEQFPAPPLSGGMHARGRHAGPFAQCANLSHVSADTDSGATVTAPLHCWMLQAESGRGGKNVTRVRVTFFPSDLYADWAQLYTQTCAPE